MEVTHDSEIGAEASFQPTGACGCYYESRRAGRHDDVAATARRARLTRTAPTPGVYTHCNFGYCEAQ